MSVVFGCPHTLRSFGEYTRCKRFASEEEVTVHLQQLNLAQSTGDHTPRHALEYDPSQFSPPCCSDPQNEFPPTQPTLLITALTGCPGLLADKSGSNNNQGDHMIVGLSHVTESERSPNAQSTSIMLTDEQQSYVCKCTGQHNVLCDEQVITGSSPLKLIDDTSTRRSNIWSLTGGDEVLPPLGAVRPQPESITGLNSVVTDIQFPVLDRLKYVPNSSNVYISACHCCHGFIQDLYLGELFAWSLNWV